MERKFNFIIEKGNDVILIIKLVPNSSFSKVVDYTGEFIRIKIASPALENRANRELTAYCSQLFCVNKSKIKIVSGEKSKLKKILIEDTKSEDIIQKLMFVLDSENKKDKRK